MEKIIEVDPTFCVGYYAPYFDECGDDKMRTLEMVHKVHNDKYLFLCMLEMQTQRNCAFRGQAEPTSLKWALVKFTIESNPQSEYNGHKKLVFQGVAREKGKVTVLRPKREKSDFEMEAHENPDDAHCSCKMLSILRERCSTAQVHVFCKPVKGKLFKDEYDYNPHKKISKAECSDMVRKIAIEAGFSNPNRCTGHAPRERVHDLLAFGQVPLGAQGFKSLFNNFMTHMCHTFFAGEQLKFTDHKDIAAHARCMNEQSAQAKDMRIKALHCKPIKNNENINKNDNVHCDELNCVESMSDVSSAHGTIYPVKIRNLYAKRPNINQTPPATLTKINNPYAKRPNINQTPPATPTKINFNAQKQTTEISHASSCANKNTMNNPYLKNKNQLKRSSMLKEEHMRATAPNAHAGAIINNAHNTNSAFGGQTINAASIVNDNYIENEINNQNKQLTSVIRSMNRLFNKGMSMSSPRRTLSEVKSGVPKISFKEKILNFIDRYEFDANNTNDRCEMLILLNSTLISQLLIRLTT